MIESNLEEDDIVEDVVDDKYNLPDSDSESVQDFDFDKQVEETKKKLVKAKGVAQLDVKQDDEIEDEYSDDQD